jgi:hypothetical protein
MRVNDNLHYYRECQSPLMINKGSRTQWCGRRAGRLVFVIKNSKHIYQGIEVINK